MVNAFSPNLLLLEYSYEKQAGWNWDIKIDQKLKKKKKGEGVWLLRAESMTSLTKGCKKQRIYADEDKTLNCLFVNSKL